MVDEQRQDLLLVYLRRALQHLYDPGELYRNPLQGLLGVDPTADRVAALRKILLDTIQALKPDDKTPLESNAWRIYDLLSFRFVEQSSQKEVAADLSLSIRQLQRLENIAFQVLCDTLASRYKLTIEMKHFEKRPESLVAQVQPVAGSADVSGMVKQELDWLRKSGRNEEIVVALLVETAMKTITSLLQAMNTKLQIQIDANLPLAFAKITPCRQALVNLLTAAVQLAKNGQVNLTATTIGVQINILISTMPVSSEDWPDRSGVDEFVSVARQLVELSGGKLEIPNAETNDKVFEASLVLPAVQHKVVLIIEDNSDTLLLMERYLSGSIYQVMRGQDPSQAVFIAETNQPHIIVLDVMLPGIDGWNLLGQLKSNPATQKIPVIVSTILPQESLALMLGADDFMQKPFTPAQFLAVLERQTSPLGIG